MNRNNERHFLQVPQMHTNRTRFNRDQTILTTFNSGRLIPFFVDEVLPGDTFQVDTSAIIRMTTPKYPVMDDAFIDFYYFYCPNRILWEDFKQFMGEANETPWMPEKTYQVPKIVINGNEKSGKPLNGSILDYMGVPTKVNAPFEINALPVRAYVMIWNEYFRDQNIENAAMWRKDDAKVTYTQSYNENSGAKDELEKTLQEAITGGLCLPVNRFHDYFSSCLPYPQRGPEVALPMQGNARITGFTNDQFNEKAPLYANSFFDGSTNPGNTKDRLYAIAEDGSTGSAYLNIGTGTGTNHTAVYLGADLNSVTAATINDLRKAVAVQQYYEAMARGGSRYREQVQALWDVTISDKTVQIPEYLGGGRYHVNMNQIVQTSGQQTENDTPIGETGAMSVTPINESSFTKSFEEHGFVIGVMCIRHSRTYQQGLERFWSRTDRLDYYVPQFANLGEQPVKKKEIMLTGTATDEETFGYQEAWADYRMKPNRVSGLMRSNAEGTLDFWHYADNYSTVPTLSQEWMSEGKTEIARTLIEQNEDQFFGAIRVANKTTRCMPLYSVPGLYKL